VLYFTIPLALALAALAVIAIIIWRKIPFLRKLTPESHEVGSTWLHDMAPETVDWFRGIPWKRYQQDVLVEFEKFLRRVRLVFSTIDRVSEQLVRKVRQGHQQAAKEVVAQQLQAAKKEEPKDIEEIDLEDPEQLKAEEQRLIVAIAQEPRDASLYSDLARVYMKMRNYRDAVESLEAAAKLNPENESYVRRLESAKNRLVTSPPV
jgi:tetratricopeptide (TPR) repeat protein